jgi:hypothetical protein
MARTRSKRISVSWNLSKLSKLWMCNDDFVQNNSWAVLEIWAVWLPVRCESNTPAGVTCVIEWIVTTYTFGAWNILVQWWNTSVIRLNWMCFVLLPLTKCMDHISLKSQLLPVWTTILQMLLMPQLQDENYTSLFTSILIVPVFGLGAHLLPWRTGSPDLTQSWFFLMVLY